jgi:hypothetical protein
MTLHQQEFGHTHVYDVNLLDRVGMDEEPPLILWTIGWEKLYGGDRMTRSDGWMTLQLCKQKCKHISTHRLA